MNKSTFKPLIMVCSLLIGACSAQATEQPISPEDIQATAVAAALTIVAETQAAIPTNTPIPPTDTPVPTPLPTETPVPLPTLEVPTLAPTLEVASQPTNDTGGDPCNQPLPGSIDGAPTKILVKNMTKGTLVGSLYLNKTPFGECGWRGFNLGKNDSVLFTDLVQGCYNVAVFVNDNNGKDTKAFGYGCINNPDKWTFEVYADNVRFGSP